jgi:serine/threonine protein kinase
VKLKDFDGTEINGMGPVIDEEALKIFSEKMNHVKEGDTLVLAGSIPASMPKNIYSEILKMCEGRGIRFVVDATGELLKNVLPYQPFLIKPNSHELGDLFGVTLKTKEEVAIKIESKNIETPQLIHESKILTALNNNDGFPKVYLVTPLDDVLIMVMELLGQNLEDLFTYCTKNFTLKTILMITIQLIERIKHVHDNNYIHRDIKPQNFLVGKDSTAKTIYILDFGLAKRYRDEHTHIHIPLKENRNLTGTARYASCNAHNGLEQSRRDDMESIAYVILYFFKGKLPWQGLKCKDKNEKYAKIKEMKMSMTPEKLCEGFPNEFAKYLAAIKKLGFEEEPAYKNYIQMFTNLFKSKDFEMDYLYDWVTVKNNTNVLKDASLMRSEEYSKQADNSKKNDENIDSTIKGNNNDTQAMGNNQQNVINDMKNYNADIMGEDDKTPDGKRRGKNKKENCTLF